MNVQICTPIFLYFVTPETFFKRSMASVLASVCLVVVTNDKNFIK